MNNKVDAATREHFRDWLRGHLQAQEFYQRRGDHYLIREFARYCQEQGAPVDEASLGRYVNREGEAPVLPTPERCRALARGLHLSPLLVLIHAGYITSADFNGAFPDDLAPDALYTLLKQRLGLPDVPGPAAPAAPDAPDGRADRRQQTPTEREA